MNTYIRYSLIAALILSLGTGTARAGDDEAIAAIGGFVAGIITGAAIDNHHVDRYRDRDRYAYDCARPGGHHDRDYRKSGHWEWRSVKVWVPGYWEVTYNRHGNRIRVWNSGHYKWRKNRVWIPCRIEGRHHHRN